MYNKHSQLNKNTDSAKLVIGKILEQTLHQRRQTDGEETQEKLFNVISHQENAKGNYKVTLHTHQKEHNFTTDLKC